MTAGTIEPVTVGGHGLVRHPDLTIPRRDRGTALLAPFDPLLWDRDRVERLFGFRYRIEIYTLNRSGNTATTSCPSCSTADRGAGGSQVRPSTRRPAVRGPSRNPTPRITWRRRCAQNSKASPSGWA